jgi:acyl-CoA synthetase
VKHEDCHIRAMELLKIDLTKFLDNKAIVYYEDEEKSNIVKYKDLLKQVLKISLVLEQESLSRNEAISIGIFCTKSPATIALSLAIIESGFGFCNLTRDDIDNDLDNLGCKYFFSDSHFTSNYGIRGSFELFGKNFRLYRSSSFAPVKIFDDFGDDLNRICYTVTTSGSTGKRKIVHVPFKCILPNVDSLQQIFRLENDVILASAPCTFDVFILDMILALHSGSQILILNENLRYSRKAIELLCNSITFLQITPSLFKNYGIDIIKNKILHPNSNLK